MWYKWTGACLILAACGGFGFFTGAACRREILFLQRLLRLVDNMEFELSYQLTPLPQLCRNAGKTAGGSLHALMDALANELDHQHCPDAAGAMACVLCTRQNFPSAAKEILTRLGESLGRFDLSGQLKSLQAVRAHCTRELEALEDRKDERIRGYRTLGLCAGAAMIILFI